MIKVAICAPGKRLDKDRADAVLQLVERRNAEAGKARSEARAETRAETRADSQAEARAEEQGAGHEKGRESEREEGNQKGREEAGGSAAIDAGSDASKSVELHIHPQCFARHGHFAGDDATRLAALLECANDPAYDAVWFAMGGYGACRIAEDALDRMNAAARRKVFLGYSDCGYLLGGLYKAGNGRPVHGPLVGDIRRKDGEICVARSLDWLVAHGAYVEGEGGQDSGLGEGENHGAHSDFILEPSLDACAGKDRGPPTVAFNLTTLAMLVGTRLMPDLTNHVVMIEEVSEHLYAVDRMLFHVTQNLRGVAGLRLGRITEVPENDRPFGTSSEQIAQYWCEKSGIPFLGSADIGHDSANKIVPFGVAARTNEE